MTKERKKRRLTLDYEISYRKFRELLMERFSEIHTSDTCYYYARMPDYDSFVLGYHHVSRTRRSHRRVMHDTELRGVIRTENGKTEIEYAYDVPGTLLPFPLAVLIILLVGVCNVMANSAENAQMAVTILIPFALVASFFSSGLYQRMVLMRSLKDFLKKSRVT